MKRFFLALFLLLVLPVESWAAFPQVATSSSGNSGAQATSHVVTLPSGIASGDLLIGVFVTKTINGAGHTWPGGWTSLVMAGHTCDCMGTTVQYRIADGTEGASITIDTSSSVGTAYAFYRITGFDGAPQVSADVDGTSTNPDPPSLTPSGGAADTLWIAIAPYVDGTTTVSAYPTNFSANQLNPRWNSANGVGLGSATRELNAASEDPGTFTIGSSGSWTAVTFSVAPTATSPVTRTVSASADDAQQVGTTMTLTGTTIGADLDATTDWAGMRFLNIPVPPGSTINTATLEVVPSATTTDEPLVTIFFENADNCATFTTGASNISGRAMTSSVAWSSTDLGATGANYFSAPNLASILQTVINRVGWASGNAVCVIIQGGATTTRDLTIEAYDLGPGTNPPKLTIAWTAASGAIRTFTLLGVGS